MANNSLYNALGGGLPAQVPQQAAPSPVPPGAPGEGSIFQALAQGPMNQMGAKPLELGPQVADNTGLMKGNPFFHPASAQQEAPSQQQQVVYHPPQKQEPPTQSLADTAANYFRGMKK